MEMNPETIKALLDAFDRSDWREMTVTVGSDRLHVSRDPSSSDGAPPAAAAPGSEGATAAPVGAAEAPSPDAPPPVPDGAPPETTTAARVAEAGPAAAVAEAGTAPGTPVESPSVGLFWRAPSPGEPPFVEVGSRVDAGATLGIVEVMKLMNHLVAPVAGVVTAILVDNGAAVEFGQTLVTIDPEG